MNQKSFAAKLKLLRQQHAKLLHRKNRLSLGGNGIYDRHEFPVLTAAHTPLEWRYDFNPKTNPHLMTRLGVNAVFNVGAIELDGKIVLLARVEGWDRKSFFAVAESKNGVDHFRFWDFPVRMPELDSAETNLYDMRLVRHEDGWIYGLFCAERHDDSRPNDLENPAKQIAAPGGHFMGPEGDERVGDVSNVVFANGWVARKNGDVLVYYGSSDTRTHVATTTVDKLLDYCLNTPPDARRSKLCVEQRSKLIEKNR